jgi:hypothetical protein
VPIKTTPFGTVVLGELMTTNWSEAVGAEEVPHRGHSQSRPLQETIAGFPFFKHSF